MNQIDKKMGWDRENAFKFHWLDMVKKQYLVKNVIRRLNPSATMKLKQRKKTLNQSIERSKLSTINNSSWEFKESTR